MRRIAELKADVALLKAEAKELATESDSGQLSDKKIQRLEELVGADGDDGLIKNAERELNRYQNVVSRIPELAGRLDRKIANGGLEESDDDEKQLLEGNVYNKGEAFHNKTTKFGEIKNALAQAVIFAAGGRTGIHRDIRAAMTEGSNDHGGYRVPIEISSETVDLARNKSVLMQAGTRLVTQKSDQMMIITHTDDPTFDTYGELEDIDESEMKFGSQTVIPHKFATIVPLSRELVDDATPDIIQELSEVLYGSLAVQLDYVGINGATGVTGLLTTPGIGSTASIGAIDWLDLAAATTALRTLNYEPNSFLMAPSIHDALFNKQTGDGVNAARGWLEAPPSIRNKNFLHSNNVPVAKVIAGDFSAFKWVLRQAMLIEVTTEGEYFKKHGVGVKITWRGSFHATRPAAFHVLGDVTAS